MKKKILLLVLISLAFIGSANALSIELPTTCIDNKPFEDELNELTKLSNSEKDNLTYKSQINKLQEIISLVNQSHLKCKTSPEGNLVNNKREGEWTWYDEYNNTTKIGNYINGLKEGIWLEPSTNSNFATQMHYKNDVLDGKYTVTEYASPFDMVDFESEKDLLKMQILLFTELERDQEVVDMLKKRLEAVDFPKIIVEGYYVNGKRDGYWIDNSKGQNYSSQGNYINGNKDGTWSYYDYSGEVYKSEYEDGVLIKNKLKNEL